MNMYIYHEKVFIQNKYLRYYMYTHTRNILTKINET